jgi:hypothetical protein
MTANKKIEAYTQKIKEAQAELNKMPNSTRTKAQYANLIDKIVERKDLEDIKVTIGNVETSVLEVLKTAMESITTPESVKNKRKQLNKVIRVNEKKILIELGVKTDKDEDEGEEETE